MSKILILSNNDAGMWLFRKELPERLIADGHTVYLSVPDGDYVERLRALGVKVTTCLTLQRRGKNPVKDLQLMQDYRRLIRHVRPDVVLTYTIKPNVYGGIAARMEHVPVIANVTGLGDAIEGGGVLAKLTLALYKDGLRDARCVFFQNADNECLFVERGIAEGCTRLLNGSGVNLTQYTALPYPGTTPVRLLYAGRLLKDKGIDELLEVMRRLHDGQDDPTVPIVSLDIAGYCDEDYESVLRMAERNFSVTYHGMVDDLRPLYEKAHAIVLPSYHEGMNNVLQEAAACARPLLASDIAGCREIVDDGTTGLLFAPRSADALYDAIMRFCALPHEEKEQMGRAGRKKMETSFDRQQVTDAYLEEIGKVCGT